MRLFFLIPCLGLFANPTGVHIAHGKAVLEESAKTLQIEVSDNAILEWENFSIGVDERTSFIQESSRSTVLNRVVGSQMSQIHGILESNGNVFLVNSAGILIGKSAMVHGESFFISAFSLSDQAFFNRTFIQEERGGRVIHEGNILARGSVSIFSSDEMIHRGAICARNISVFTPQGLVDVEGILKAQEISIFSDSIFIRPAAELSTGGGGKIILKGEKSCFQHGSLMAEGGFIEVSGKQMFELGGKICAGSPDRPGKLLLDPTDIDLGIGVTTAPSFTYPPAEPQFDRPGPTAFLNIADLVSQLENGVSVTIQTTPGAGGVGRIQILAPILWNGGTDLTFIADENILVLADIENFSSGSIALNATGDVLIQSGAVDRARVYTISGDIEVTAQNLEITSGGAPAEINAIEGLSSISLAGDLNITGGLGIETDAVAALRGQSVQINAAGAAVLTGGASARSSAEISSSKTSNLQIGGTLTLQGGAALDASAVIQGSESLTVDVGLGGSILSGMGAPARIGSDFGTLQIDIGTSVASNLLLTGNAMGGNAIINAHNNLSISSTQNITSNLGQIFTRSGSLTLSAGNVAGFSNGSLLSSFYALGVASGPFTLNNSKFMASQGGASLVSTGAISFLNGSEISTFPTALFQGTTFTLDLSLLKGIGAQTFQFTGAISFLNSSLIHFPTAVVNGASWTLDQSIVHLTALSSTLSGNFILQNGAFLNVDNGAMVTFGGMTMSSAILASGDLMFGGGAASFTNSTLFTKGAGILSGTSLTATGSIIESTHATFSLNFSGNGSLTNSIARAASDFSAGFALLSLDQSVLQSLTSSQRLTLSNTGTVMNGSTIQAGTMLNIMGTQLNVSSSNLISSVMDVSLSTGFSLAVNSLVFTPVSFSLSFGTICDLNLSLIRGGDLFVSGPTLQLVDSTMIGERGFQIQVPSLSLMNSRISDPYSTIEN